MINNNNENSNIFNKFEAKKNININILCDFIIQE